MAQFVDIRDVQQTSSIQDKQVLVNDSDGNAYRANVSDFATLLGGAAYAGVATPVMTPSVGKQKVFYLTTQEGTYTNFGSLTVESGKLTVLLYNGSAWEKQVLDLPTSGGGSTVNVVQSTGASTTDVMSQKAVTDELDNRQTKPSVSGSEGQVLTKTGSGDDEVEWADVPAPEYAQETGNAEDTAMSQAAVTRELNSINSILNEQYSKIASFTASPSVVEKGIGAQSIKLSWRTTFNDQTITPDSLSVKKSTSGTPLTTDKTLTTVTDSASADTTYTLEAVIKGVTKTATAYARFYYPQFAGASASESLASADVLALGNKVVAASVARTVTVQVEQGQYFWFAVPENFSITSIKMGGFDVSLNAVATVAVDGRGNYKCYRSAKPQSAGSYTFEIK